MAADREEIVFGDEKYTTRRRYELLNLNEVDQMMKTMFREVDFTVEMAEAAWVPTGEMEITISVQQRMKKASHDED